MTRPSMLTTLALLLYACTPPPPDRVYVQADGFHADLAIRLDLEEGNVARAGQWIDLHAERTMGPWVEVDRSSLAPETQWLTSPPPATEREVQANVRWMVEPAGQAEFNLPAVPDLFRRQVRFSAPGTYRIRASTSTWGGDPVESNEIVVEVVP